MAEPIIALASDHAGLALKQALAAHLAESGREPVDLGTEDAQSVDYPDYADRMAEALRTGRAQLGVLVCGTGIGISIAANRHRHVRAALCHDVTTARLARAHNNANVLALGGRTTGIATAIECLEAFLEGAFEGGRHARRVDKFS